ncbi:MAG: carboxymuconolactone decarboxylase family protein [Proteobacteria bacterium]|nr:carboxymuconolactone decarboxylase family protein [Pseudomonadota bacterium]
MVKKLVSFHSMVLVLLALSLASALQAQDQRRSGTPLDQPRIPRAERPWTEAQREILAPRERNGNVLGVWSTCAQAPELCNAWLVFTDYLLQESTLPIRDRELLILRIGWLNGGAYEWAAHAGLARSVGISDAEMQRILEGPDAVGWSAWDATLLRAADELHANALVTDSTWNALAERYDRRQMMEAVFTVGQYNMVAMYLNSLGVQFDEGFEGFPLGDTDKIAN